MQTDYSLEYNTNTSLTGIILLLCKMHYIWLCSFKIFTFFSFMLPSFLSISLFYGKRHYNYLHFKFFLVPDLELSFFFPKYFILFGGMVFRNQNQRARDFRSLFLGQFSRKKETKMTSYVMYLLFFLLLKKSSGQSYTL